MQRMQNKAQQKLNKADETAKWNNSFYGQLLLFFVTENNKKINFYGGATTNYKKK